MKTLFCDFLNIYIFVMSSFLKFLNFRYKEISRRMRILLPVLAATILISGILTGELLLNVMNLEKKNKSVSVENPGTDSIATKRQKRNEIVECEYSTNFKGIRQFLNKQLKWGVKCQMFPKAPWI